MPITPIAFTINGKTITYQESNGYATFVEKSSDLAFGKVADLDTDLIKKCGFTQQQANDFLKLFDADGNGTLNIDETLKGFQTMDAWDGNTNNDISGCAFEDLSSKASGISNTGTDYSYTVQKGNSYKAIAENIYNSLYADSGIDKATLLPKIEAAIKAHCVANKQGSSQWPFADVKGGANVINLNEALKGVDPQPKAFSKAAEDPTKTDTDKNKVAPEKPKNFIEKLLGNNWMKTIGIVMMGIGGAMALGLFGGGGILGGLFGGNQTTTVSPDYGAAGGNDLFGGLF